jgi:bifunctional DNA-binding transcriptional regulator/antitoxin component of YhaV-PrlF toxin-antitoxin module
MANSKLSAKGQVTLPRKVRQVLKVKPGEGVLFLVEDEMVRLQPLAATSARALAGSLRRFAGSRASRLARGLIHKEVASAAAQEG